MHTYGNQKNRINVAVVDKDNVAFYVLDNEIGHITEFIAAAIIAKCLMEYGVTPEELD